MNSKQVCATDLDGTLLPHQGEISPANLDCLKDLQARGITTVLVTGRSLYSLRRYIFTDAPFDYVIFSTGAGIMDWRTQELIHTRDLSAAEIRKVSHILEDSNIDYMLHDKIPNTHLMHYREKVGYSDFRARVELYRDYSSALDESSLPKLTAATQFLAIAEPQREDIYQELCQSLDPLTTVRTTSPLDLKSLWIEIFAPGVHKGSSLKLLLDRLNVPHTSCMVIGNDFNDLDMLEICDHAFVTANAPDQLRQIYRTVPSCEDDGFAAAVKIWLT